MIDLFERFVLVLRCPLRHPHPVPPCAFAQSCRDAWWAVCAAAALRCALAGVMLVLSSRVRMRRHVTSLTHVCPAPPLAWLCPARSMPSDRTLTDGVAKRPRPASAKRTAAVGPASIAAAAVAALGSGGAMRTKHEGNDKEANGVALQMWKRLLLTMLCRSEVGKSAMVTAPSVALALRSKRRTSAEQPLGPVVPANPGMRKRRRAGDGTALPDTSSPTPTSPAHASAPSAPAAPAGGARTPVRRTRSGALVVGVGGVPPGTRTPEALCQRRFNASLHALRMARAASAGELTPEQARQAAKAAADVIGVTHTPRATVDALRARMAKAVSLSPIDSFSLHEIDAHLYALRSESFICRFRPIIVRLMDHSSNGGIFNAPVDAEALNLPDYHTVVKHPMDLGTIRARLEAGSYTSHKDLANDVRLVFSNAQLFNPPTHPVHLAAGRLSDEFEGAFYRLTVKSDAELARRAAHSCNFCQGQACALCGDKCLKFDPPVLFCDHCGERVRRGAHFFRAPTGQRWCTRCVSTGVCFPKPKKLTSAAAPAPAPAVGGGASAAAGAPATNTPTPSLAGLPARSVPSPALTPSSVTSAPATAGGTPALRASSSSTSLPAKPVGRRAPTARPRRSVSPTPKARARQEKPDKPEKPRPRFVLRLNLARRSVTARETLTPAGTTLTAANSLVVGANTTRRPRSKSKSKKRSRARSASRLPRLRPGCPWRLERHRNDDMVAEPWVQCDGCSRWVHQICGLFNGRKHCASNSEYFCPLCRREQLVFRGNSAWALALKDVMAKEERAAREERTAAAGRDGDGDTDMTVKSQPGEAAGDAGSIKHAADGGGDGDGDGDVDMGEAAGSDSAVEATPAQAHTVPVKVKAEHAPPALDASNVGAGDPAPVSPPRRLPTRSPDQLASTLPTTPLSLELEQRVADQLRQTGHGAVVDTICVREVSSVMLNLSVPEEMQELLRLSQQVASPAAAEVQQPVGTRAAHVYPSDIPYRQRVMLLFQQIDDVDVCLFALYVQEYGANAPAPNTRRVYIAYLDSVRYLQPLSVRTQIYHELLVAYMANARRRGYVTANIWACPPQRGDGYIFHRHPSQQRTPTKERLRRWYDDMIERSRAEGVVDRVVSLHKQFFSTEHRMRLDTGLPPVFAGDYWATEVPRGIKDLSKPRSKKGKSKAKAKPKTSKRKGRGCRRTKRTQAPTAAVDAAAALSRSPRGVGSAPGAKAKPVPTAAPPTPNVSHKEALVRSAACVDAAVAPSTSPPPPAVVTRCTSAPANMTSTSRPDVAACAAAPPALQRTKSMGDGSGAQESKEQRVVRLQNTMGQRLLEAESEHMVIHFTPLTDALAADADALEKRTAGTGRISCDFFDTRHGFLRMCQGNNFQVRAPWWCVFVPADAHVSSCCAAAV